MAGNWGQGRIGWGGMAMVAGAMGGIAPPALAQNVIIPDGTLGAESSVVTPSLNGVSRITGGAVRGGNLFHSFDTFNVGNGGTAFFVGGADTANIFSRVTGASPSEIFGTLGTAGTAANLYFINPNGIVFGPNAALQVGGSFTATTASGVGFGVLGTYSTTDPQAPSPLLTVDPSAYFFGPGNAGSIITEAPLLPFLGGAELQVPDGKNLTLLGGEVVLDRSSVVADEGRIEIGAVGVAGVVGLEVDGGLSFPDGLGYRDIEINQATVTSINSVGGINLTGGDIFVFNNSIIGVALSGGSVDSPNRSSDLSIRASGNLIITEASLITNQIVSDGVGKGGDLEIVATNLQVLDGAEITASIFGIGDAGNVIIDISETVLVQGIDPVDGSSSGAFSSIQPGGEGTGGNIQITASNLEVLDGAQISTGVFGIGDTGNVILTISETALFQGGDLDSSGVFSVIGTDGEGSGGDVQITASNLEVLDGAQISTGVFGIGDTGNVILTISETALFQGRDSVDGTLSGAFSRIEPDGEGDGGDVQITASNLEVLDGAQISASTFGVGDAGNVALTISETALFQGSDPIDGVPSGAFSSIGIDGEGSGGDVQITASNLEVLDGAQISAGVFGIGDAGNVTLVISETALFQGSDPIDGSSSRASSVIQPGGEGSSGDVQIMATNLEVLDGAQINASTSGVGDAGNVILTIGENVLFQGSNPIDGSPSGAFSAIDTNGDGDGGEVKIAATNLEVLDGAQISTSNFGIGNAGNVILTIGESVLFQGSNSINGSPSGAFSTIQPGGEGEGGDVQITATNLEVLDGAQIGASTFGVGDAGNVILAISETMLFQGRDPIDGSASGAFSSIQPGGEGTGGNVQITATNLEVLDGAVLFVGSLGVGDAGNIILDIQNQLLANDGLIATSVEADSGGQITISADTIQLFGNSDIQAFVESGDGGGGDITLTADLILAFDDSDIFAFAADGNGGNITLATPAFFGENFTLESLTADPATLDGNDRVDINATGAVSGAISLPDTSLVENSIAGLTEAALPTDQLVAGSCIAQRESTGSFVVTGVGGVPPAPSDVPGAVFATGDIRSTPTPAQTFTEPTGVFRLADGRLVLSQHCQ